MSQTKQLKIRPYARLLTMLGEQLIKNERIALVELIKNSYDADADWVKVTFQGFGSNYKIKPDSKIIIEDNGHGMDQQIIEDHWLNPATPEKLKRKKTRDKTSKGRIIHGEKGIGRFAIFKLGRKVEIISKTKDDQQEHCVSYDFSRYDDDFLTENGDEKDLYIDDLRVTLVNRIPKRLVSSDVIFGSRNKKRLNHGTIIEINNLKGSWTRKKITALCRDLCKLESIFPIRKRVGFEVSIYEDEEYLNYHQNYLEKLAFLLAERAVIKIENGCFDSEHMEYRFSINGKEEKISILDPEIRGLKVFRDRFTNAVPELENRARGCGNFGFFFYVFDFSTQALAKYKLDKEDKSIIKEHRIYLYRDDIRVYPYGEPDDDWLRIDAYRGTISAGHFLSNDQVVGFVTISHKRNKKLKDKTNREGLIDEGNATGDFITFLQSFLAYIRQKPYARYRIGTKIKRTRLSSSANRFKENLIN